MARQLTKEEIQKKWDHKYEDVEKYKNIELRRKIEELRVKIHERTTLEIERQTEKLQRKSRAYLNKKKTENDRKCKNEIRRLEGKEERQYKQKAISRNKKLQIALKIAQENSKLRDTNSE